MKDPAEAWNEVVKALAELYEVYYRQDSEVVRHRIDIERALFALMITYNAYLN